MVAFIRSLVFAALVAVCVSFRLFSSPGHLLLGKQTALHARSFSWISKPSKSPSKSQEETIRTKESSQASAEEKLSRIYSNNVRTSPSPSPFRPKKERQESSGPKKEISEAKFNTQRKRVERVVAPDARVPLSAYSPGQELVGTVISFSSYGMFVDVGTSMDGLVHVRDASDVYFVPDLSTRYKPGQEVKVWVKYADATSKSLALQLFPYSAPLQKKYDWDDLKYEMPLQGKIVKLSEMGAYVDIGGPTLAFMPRRNMKSNYRQRNLKPWELVQINSAADCYVMRVEEDTRRILVSTFPPEEWEKRFLLNFDDKASRVDTSKSDRAALARTLALKKKESAEDEELSEDEQRGEDEEEGEYDEEDFEEEDEEDEGEDFAGHKLLFDDMGLGATRSKSSALTVKDVDAAELDDGELDEMFEEDEGMDSTNPFAGEGEISSDDLFQDLSAGKTVVTLRDVKKWEYLRQIVEGGEMEYSELPKMFAQAGARRGVLTPEQFNSFMAIFAERLGLEASYEYDDDDEMEGEEDIDGLGMEGDDEEDPEEMMLSSSSARLPESVTPVSKPNFDEVKVGNTFFSGAFKQLAGKEDTISLEKLLGWDYCKAMVASGKLDGEELKEIAKFVLGKEKMMTADKFRVFVEQLQGLTEDSKEMDDDLDLFDEDDDEEDGELIDGDDDIVEVNSIDDEEDEAELMRQVFVSLANGKEYVTAKDLMNWDFVFNAIGEGIMTEEEMQKKIAELAPMVKGKKAKGLDCAGFDRFVDELIIIFGEAKKAEEG